jgi:hypothetical protein
MTTPLPFVADLRGALLDGIALDGRRRRRRLATALMGTVALVAVLVTDIASRETERALAVTRASGTIELRIADAAAGAREMTRDLRNAGIDGEVRVVPVEPGLVGRWAAVVEVAGSRGPHETVRLNRIDISPDAVRLSVEQVRESTGRFLFLAGRRPRSGEPPAIRNGLVPRELLR